MASSLPKEVSHRGYLTVAKLAPMGFTLSVRLHSWVPLWRGPSTVLGSAKLTAALAIRWRTLFHYAL